MDVTGVLPSVPGYSPLWKDKISQAWATSAQGGLANEGFDIHDFHETADPFPSDVPTMRDEFEPELARSQDKPLRVELVEDFHDRMVFAGGFGFARSEAVAVDAYKLALPAHGELGVLSFHHGLSLRSIPSCTHFF